ncbi:MAG: ATP-binding protein [Bacteroidales bacterium]|nr:ATP-binding protein [Bacteroidales bacterium]
MKVKNPFVIGHYVSSEYFCDRENETAELVKNIENGRNVLLISNRRLGKTGLIEHVFTSTDIAKGYYTFFIDIYAMNSLNEMVYELAKRIFSSQVKRKKNFAEQFSAIVKSLTTSFSFDAQTGLPSINLSLGEMTQPQTTLDELLECLERADKPCVVAIDEFQQIVNFGDGNVEAILRTKIQRLKNVQFVYAGSQSHILSNMFNSPSRPFYNSVVMMKLGPIALDVYTKFAQKLFRQHGKDIDGQLAEEVYNHFKGVTWYLQLFMNEVFSLTERGEVANKDVFEEALHNIVAVKIFAFEDMYSRLTEKQKMLLKAIAAENDDNISLTSQAFLKRHHLPSSSAVQTAMKGLVEKGVLTDVAGKKEINDLLFEDWLRKG